MWEPELQMLSEIWNEDKSNPYNDELLKFIQKEELQVFNSLFYSLSPKTLYV